MNEHETPLDRQQADALAQLIADSADTTAWIEQMLDRAGGRWIVYAYRSDGSLHSIHTHEQARREGWRTVQP